MIKRIFYEILGVILLLAIIVAVRTISNKPAQRTVDMVKLPQIDIDNALESLSQAIKKITIADAKDALLNEDWFLELHKHLQSRYPLFYANTELEVINDLSLLFKWQGSNPDLKPIGLMAHQDVVPIAPGTEEHWEVDPFSGEIKDGFIWGRGALDDKSSLIAIFEAAELLMEEGFASERTIYFIFGADEEVTGQRGAKPIADLFAERDIQPEFILDEGMAMLDGIVDGVDNLVAAIGIAEKGYLTLKLEVEATPGHSSMPPARNESAIAQISTALTKLDAQRMPAKIDGVVKQMLTEIAPEMGGVSRVALSNLWLFGPLVKSQLQSADRMNAAMRTTTALTIINAGNKENVLPGRAEATVNFRLLPGDTDKTVVDFVRRTIGNENIKISVVDGYAAPSSISSTDSKAYDVLQQSILEVFPNAVLMPSLVLAATDSRHFEGVADDVYRFSPMRMTADLLEGVHGTNERLYADNLGEMIAFYYRIMVNAGG